MNNRRETFTKSERLCSKKIIAGLFESGNVFHTSLFKVVWDYSPSPIPLPVRTAFSVSKRSFPLAVTRNLIKRRLREAYRKRKHILYEYLEHTHRQIVMVVIIRGYSVPDYGTVETAMDEMLAKLIRKTGPDGKRD